MIFAMINSLLGFQKTIHSNLANVINLASNFIWQIIIYCFIPISLIFAVDKCPPLEC